MTSARRRKAVNRLHETIKRTNKTRKRTHQTRFGTYEHFKAIKEIQGKGANTNVMI